MVKILMVVAWTMVATWFFNPVSSVFGWGTCTECPKCECPDVSCPRCPDCVCNPAEVSCPEFPGCPECQKCPDVVCPDPCPSPCSGDVDVSGTYAMIGMGAANAWPLPEIVLGTITIFPNGDYGTSYQCLVTGNGGRVGCATYFLRKD